MCQLRGQDSSRPHWQALHVGTSLRAKGYSDEYGTTWHSTCPIHVKCGKEPPTSRQKLALPLVPFLLGPSPHSRLEFNLPPLKVAILIGPAGAYGDSAK